MSAVDVSVVFLLVMVLILWFAVGDIYLRIGKCKNCGAGASDHETKIIVRAGISRFRGPKCLKYEPQVPR